MLVRHHVRHLRMGTAPLVILGLASAACSRPAEAYAQPECPQSKDTFPLDLEGLIRQYEGRDFGDGVMVRRVGSDLVVLTSREIGIVIVPFNAIRPVQLTGETTFVVRTK